MEDDEYTIDLSNTNTTYNITLDSTTTDIITIDSSVADITMVTNSLPYDISHEWLTINDINLDELTIGAIEFEDHMPSVAKVEDMCEEYPALRKAYENFKTIYAMVHQDWQGKQDAENK